MEYILTEYCISSTEKCSNQSHIEYSIYIFLVQRHQLSSICIHVRRQSHEDGHVTFRWKITCSIFSKRYIGEMQQPDKRNALLHHHTDAPSPSDGKCDPDEAAPLHQGLPQQCGLDGTTPIHQGLAPWCGHDITAPLHRRLQPEILEQVQNLHKFHLPHF